MLKGFIDLVVAHHGRYFVLDYKSNWLGPTDADYSADALEQAVLEHRYELQYALYL
ncbi:MAG: Exodeoxyribonuclease beta chain, partial [Pseudomonadota bacterium]